MVAAHKEINWRSRENKCGIEGSFMDMKPFEGNLFELIPPR